jgi:hypothetical protein
MVIGDSTLQGSLAGGGTGSTSDGKRSDRGAVGSSGLHWRRALRRFFARLPSAVR